MRDKAKEMEQKLRKAQFGFDDYLESMNQMKNMGGISKYSEHDARYGRRTDEADWRMPLMKSRWHGSRR